MAQAFRRFRFRLDSPEARAYMAGDAGRAQPARRQSHNERQMDDHPSRGVAKADPAAVTSPEHHWIALGPGRVDGVSRT
jgi:hypothetical protein